MKQIRLLGFVALSLFSTQAVIRAQSLDPQFTPPVMYGVGSVNNAIEQPDGKRLVVGGFSRVNGTNTGTLVRLTASGALDAAFQQNVGFVSNAYQVTLLSNGQILVNNASDAPITAGGITRNDIVRLNADGTADASFSIGAGVTGLGGGYINNLVQLPSGKIIITGYFDHLNGAAANNIARLNSDGSLDTTFNPGTGSDTEIESVALLPNGQFLVGGYFSRYNGAAANGLVRLNADGSRDATFVPPLMAGDEAVNLAVQADGRILVSGFFTFGASQNFVRLLANGTLDNSFSAPATFTGFSVYSFTGKPFEVQPDGKILVINSRGVTTSGAGLPRIARLNADGSPDASFQVGTGPNVYPRSLRLLANGQVLVAGNFTNFSGTLDRNLIQLNTTGTIDAAFQPVIQLAGSALAVARQPDGKLVIGGTFTEINGQAMRRLARMNADGTLDATFVSNNLYDSGVLDVAVQTDGRVLAASPNQVQRFLANGSIDNSFSANLAGNSLSQMLLQPDGKILLSGNTTISLNSATTGGLLVRLLPGGGLDGTFTPVPPATRVLYSVTAIALQPDGKIVVAGSSLNSANSYVSIVKRLESTGATDASFTSSEFSFARQGPQSSVASIAVQPDGKLVVGGNFDTNGTTPRAAISRLNADGTVDAGFVAPALAGVVSRVLVQPNNRLLVGGNFSSASLPSNLARLLANGQADTSFGSSAMPNGNVRALLVQPDGKLVAGGAFTTFTGQPSVGLARLVATNVLHAAAPQAVAAQTLAWPVPASEILNVSFDVNSHPQTLSLLDVLGRPVRQQELRGAAPVALPLDKLPAGSYLLRVRYAEGTVVRQVQVR